MSKYGAVATEVDGYRFASKAEARRYGELRLLERAGEIRDLTIHQRYPLYVNGVTVAEYEADFSYWPTAGGPGVVEDVKGVRTPLYRLKARMFRAQYGVAITEVEA